MVARILPEQDLNAGAPASGWNTPSPRLRALRRYEVAAGTLGALALAVGVALAVDAAVAAVAVAVGVLIAGAAADLVAGRRVRAWGYAERDEDLLVRRGVMFRRMSVIPYGRMQYVEVTAGPFERAFGLATVQMHTAAAASDARIPGLPAVEAARLRDQLTSLGEAHAMGL
jgi:membrane protein YdbS with pleckstrin-like domain